MHWLKQWFSNVKFADSDSACMIYEGDDNNDNNNNGWKW